MKFTKEIKIAVVAIVGIIVLFYGMNFLKGLTLFSEDNIYYIAFKDISGLSSSSPIYADGYQVGVVKGRCSFKRHYRLRQLRGGQPVQIYLWSFHRL